MSVTKRRKTFLKPFKPSWHLERKVITMAEHHIYSPSSAHRFWNCPGSVFSLPGSKTDADSPQAAEGTAAHAHLEACMIGLETPKAPWAKIYVDYVESLMHSDTIAHTEERLRIPIETGFELFGTADRLHYSPTRKRLDVIDYKHGTGVWVAAKDNPQLTLYAAGGLYLYPEAETIFVHVVQPRHQATQDKIRSWQVTRDDIDKARAATAWAAHNPSMLAPGPWCKWCKNTPVCPALLWQADLALRQHKEGVKALQAGELADWMDKIAALKEFQVALTDETRARLQLGADVGGYELRTKKLPRKLLPDVEDTLHRKFGKRKTTELKTLSATQLVKRFGLENVEKYLAPVEHTVYVAKAGK